MEVCTIIAKNYIAHARVLAKSLRRHDPQARLWTLIIDDISGFVDPGQEPFEVLTPHDIGCDPFTRMAIRYSVLELSTAVKPWLLRHLMEITGGPVTYLDPDIEIYGSLRRLDELAAEHGLVLIPHNERPIPADGRRPSQVDIMIAGVFNLGFAAVAARPEVHMVLDWWSERLERDCRVDPQWGYFVDQRWFDLTPGFVPDLAVVRDPEYNVAYWNLHNRSLTHEDGRYLVDGRPLAFFHFSGFDPDHPLVLSRHQDRVDVLANPVLERILAEHATALEQAGHATARGWPYSYGALGNGVRLDDTLRALYDEYADGHDGRPPSPFTVAGAGTFMDWLAEPPAGVAGINRVLYRVHQSRSDLQAAYPDLAAAGDRSGLLRWAEEYGAREIPLLGRLMAHPDISPPSANGAAGQSTSGGPQVTNLPPLSGRPLGVNVVGSFAPRPRADEPARRLLMALDEAGIPAVPVEGPGAAGDERAGSYLTVPPEQAVFPLNVVCVSPQQLREFVVQAGEEFFAGRYSAGLWLWDVASFPDEWRPVSSLLEEVWVPSAHVAAALGPVAGVPVHTVRLPVAPVTTGGISRAELGVPQDRLLFLLAVDYGGGFERSNPLAAVDAFIRAVDEREQATLVIRCLNADRDPSAHRDLRAAVAGHPAIELIDRPLMPEAEAGLTELCDCYVSLHRAAAFGAGLAEAMWHGKPVIATGYSGNLDFMTDDNSLLVEHRLVPIGPGAGPYPAGGEWAEPSTEHAAALMRRVMDDPRAARALGAAAAADIRRTHSPQAAAEVVSRRIDAIRAVGRGRADAGAALKPALPSIQVGQQPLVAAAPGPGRAVREPLRRAVLRVIRPFTAYQQSVNRQLLAAMEQIAAQISAARLDDAAGRARLMAVLRGIEQVPRRIAAQQRRLDDLSGRLDALEQERERVR